MRAWVAAATALTLTACGREPAPAPAPAPPSGPTGQAAAASPDILGMFIATSTTAMAVSGDVEIDEAGARFKNGLAYETVVGPAVALDAAAGKGQDSLRAALGLESDREIAAVEMRSVAKETIDPAAPNAGLCGARKVTHLVFAVSPPEGNPEQDGSQPKAPQYLWIAAFTGADRPGPDAADVELCGTFLYLREIAV